METIKTICILMIYFLNALANTLFRKNFRLISKKIQELGLKLNAEDLKLVN
jgi:hypothetical protein